MLAVVTNNQEILIELLKESSIDVKAKTNNGESALLLAYKNRFIDVVGILLYLDSIFDIDISGEDRYLSF